MHLTLLIAVPTPHSIPAFQSTCAAGGKAAKCCILPVVCKFHWILVGAVLKRDGTNRLARLSFAKIPAKFVGAIDRRFGRDI